MRGLLATFAFLSAVAIASAAPSPPAAATPGGESFARATRIASTHDPAALTEFDEGLTLLYAFNPEQARVSFTRALADDPAFALAWWGVAMTYGVNINTAFDPVSQREGARAIARAQPLVASAAPVERALVAAAAIRFASTRTRDAARSARAYRDAMDAAANAFPLDDDVETLAAEAEMDVHPWSYFDEDGTATPGTLGAIARLQDVLARSPGHIGANHLLLHALEESSHPGDALAAARTLANLTFEPAAEHLTHMPAHIFMRVGDYESAGIANARAIAAYQIYLANDPAGHKDYFDHDCTFGVDAFAMSGDERRARDLAARCDGDGSRASGDVDLRFHRWDRLARDASDDFTQGMLAAHDGRTATATARLAALRGAKNDVTGVEADVLAAALARRTGAASAEIAALARAVASQDAFGYAEPPQVFFPVRELLGGAELRAGRDADAERTFRDDLARNPGNPRSLAGLALALDREGRKADARSASERASAAWHGAAPFDASDL